LGFAALCMIGRSVGLSPAVVVPYFLIFFLVALSVARLRAAKQLVEEGRRAEADAELNRALAFYREVGATTYVREGEALLAESA